MEQSLIERKISLLEARVETVREIARDCRLCPRECRIDRLSGVLGTCKTPYGPVFSSANLHFGEEPPISGTRGSGTIFMTGCNLNCLFCQNFPISQLHHGVAVTTSGLAQEMLTLQKRGAHNINLVTPTHQAAALLETLLIAYRQGLALPIVYNCGGYESLEMLRLWDGIIEVYLPDIKYSRDTAAKTVSHVPEYVTHNRTALKEMFRQVGNLVVNEEGIAVRGMIVRHLVLPDGYSDTDDAMRFIAEELSPEMHVSLMSQYFPAHKAHDRPPFDRKITRKEYKAAVAALEKYGLENGWVQPL